MVDAEHSPQLFIRLREEDLLEVALCELERRCHTLKRQVLAAQLTSEFWREEGHSQTSSTRPAERNRCANENGYLRRIS